MRSALVVECFLLCEVALVVECFILCEVPLVLVVECFILCEVPLLLSALYCASALVVECFIILRAPSVLKCQNIFWVKPTFCSPKSQFFNFRGRAIPQVDGLDESFRLMYRTTSEIENWDFGEQRSGLPKTYSGI